MKQGNCHWGRYWDSNHFEYPGFGLNTGTYMSFLVEASGLVGLEGEFLEGCNEDVISATRKEEISLWRDCLDEVGSSWEFDVGCQFFINFKPDSITNSESACIMASCFRLRARICFGLSRFWYPLSNREDYICKIIRRDDTLRWYTEKTGIRLHIEPLSRGELRNRKIIRREITLIRKYWSG